MPCIKEMMMMMMMMIIIIIIIIITTEYTLLSNTVNKPKPSLLFQTQEKSVRIVSIETVIASLLQNHTLVSGAEFL
jgi:hypothetical protein